MSDLKPCPFCGGTNLHDTGNGVGSEFIECNDCGASGPASDHSADANDYWNRRTQPEATAPAQDLSAAILALPLPDAWFRSMKRGGMLSEDGYSLAQVQELLKAAAALASSANALSAGDSEDTQFLSWVKAHRQSWLVEYRRRAPESYRAAILQSQKGDHG